MLDNIINWFAERTPEWSETTLAWLSTAGMTLLKALLILLFGLWLTSIVVRIISKALCKTKIDDGVKGFIISCTRVGLRLVIIISAIASIGINITSIVTALGAAGITLGLAMKDSLSNFASGVLVLFNHPFKVGDFIEVEGSSGTVRRIELMYTVLVTPDNKELIYPNSKMTADKIVNFTAQTSRRLDMKFPVAYDSDIALVKKCLLAACAESQYVDGSQETVVGIRELGDSSIEFELRAWIAADKYWQAYYEMEELVVSQFRSSGVSIPFSQLDVHIQQ